MPRPLALGPPSSLFGDIACAYVPKKLLIKRCTPLSGLGLAIEDAEVAARVEDEPPRDLHERERELGLLADALQSARAGSGRVVVLEGHAGVGKSKLLDATRGLAAELEMDVLAARGSELEHDFAFGVVRQLIEPRLAAAGADEPAALLEGAAALARPLLDQTVDAGVEDRSPSLVHGLHWLVSNLAERAPLVMLVDDLHWCDAPSLRFLLYVARRIDDLPVAIVAAARPGESAHTQAPLTSLAAERAAAVAAVAPLSLDAVAAIVRSQGFGRAGAEFAEACHRLTGGNPFLLVELLHSLAAEDVGRGPEATLALERLVPETILRTVVARLARLPEDALALARATAVLAENARLADAAEVSGLDVAAASRAADALAAVDLLRSGLPLAFAHPLIATSVHSDIPPAARALLHARAAAVLERRDAPIEQVAVHVLESPRSGDPHAVDTLREAARRSRVQGAPESAAAFLVRALEEPPRAAERADVLRELGAVEAITGAPTATARFEEALALERDPRRRARTLQGLARALYAQGRLAGACAQLERGLDELGDHDAELELELRAEYGHVATLDPALLQTLETPPGDLPPPRTEMKLAERAWLAQTALLMAFAAAPRDQAIAIAERAYGGGALLEQETADGTAIYAVTMVLSGAGRYEQIDRIFSDAIDEARRRGSVMGFATASFCRAYCRYLTGSITDARADLERALDARRYGWEQYLPTALALSIHLAVEDDRLDDAEQVAGGVDDRDAAALTWGPFFGARGRLRLLQGRVEAARDDFLAWQRLTGVAENPAVYNEWRSSLALALARLGQREEACRLAAEEVAVARRWGAPRPIGVALRGLGLVAADPGERLAHLQASVDVLDGSEGRLDLCTSQVELGAALRRAGQRSDARERLLLALGLAQAIGSRALARRAEEELRAAGARLRRRARSGVDSLTPSELRVAEMAAAGMTNREIAEALFVTVKAVQWHLRHVYQKLDASSREELPAALAAPAGVSAR